MISVIIPAYNEEGYIIDTIESIRRSNVPHEVIVVCSGCTDDTAALAKQYADKVLVLQERGVSKARNAGVSEAQYHKLCFLDADTKVSSNVLKEIVEADGYGTSRAGSDTGKIHDSVYFFLKYLTQYLRSSCGLIFCDKDVFHKVGGFHEHMDKFEDGTFLKNASPFAKFHVLPSPVYTSTRRYQKRGYIGTALYWVKEKFFPSGKPYEPIR